jgi:hypothetical protein
LPEKEAPEACLLRITNKGGAIQRGEMENVDEVLNAALEKNGAENSSPHDAKVD